MNRLTASLAAVAVLAVITAAAVWAFPEDAVIAHRSAAGKHAQAIAITDAGPYKHFSVHVTASPNQRVKAGWAMSCLVANLGSGRDTKEFQARTPVTRAYRALPWPGRGCRVEADATLAGKGRVTVQILAH